MELASFGLPFWLYLERPRFRLLEQDLTAEAVEWDVLLRLDSSRQDYDSVLRCSAFAADV